MLADDLDVSAWVYGIIHGEPVPSGQFLSALADAVVRADPQCYAMLKPGVLQLMARFPKYRCSCQEWVTLTSESSHGEGDVMNEKLAKVELFAWLGEDEFGSGEIGLKQGIVPAGCIPLVAVKLAKMAPLTAQMNAQAARYGMKIRLCRFALVEVLTETEHGK
jgi:hypothetical protein